MLYLSLVNSNLTLSRPTASLSTFMTLVLPLWQNCMRLATCGWLEKLQPIKKRFYREFIPAVLEAIRVFTHQGFYLNIDSPYIELDSQARLNWDHFYCMQEDDSRAHILNFFEHKKPDHHSSLTPFLFSDRITFYFIRIEIEYILNFLPYNCHCLSIFRTEVKYFSLQSIDMMYSYWSAKNSDSNDIIRPEWNRKN